MEERRFIEKAKGGITAFFAIALSMYPNTAFGQMYDLSETIEAYAFKGTHNSYEKDCRMSRTMRFARPVS